MDRPTLLSQGNPGTFLKGISGQVPELAASARAIGGAAQPIREIGRDVGDQMLRVQQQKKEAYEKALKQQAEQVETDFKWQQMREAKRITESTEAMTADRDQAATMRNGFTDWSENLAASFREQHKDNPYVQERLNKADVGMGSYNHMNGMMTEAVHRQIAQDHFKMVDQTKDLINQADDQAMLEATPNLSTNTPEVQQAWNDMLEPLTEKNFTERNAYLVGGNNFTPMEVAQFREEIVRKRFNQAHQQAADGRMTEDLADTLGQRAMKLGLWTPADREALMQTAKAAGAKGRAAMPGRVNDINKRIKNGGATTETELTDRATYTAELKQTDDTKYHDQLAENRLADFNGTLITGFRDGGMPLTWRTTAVSDGGQPLYNIPGVANNLTRYKAMQAMASIDDNPVAARAFLNANAALDPNKDEVVDAIARLGNKDVVDEMVGYKKLAQDYVSNFKNLKGEVNYAGSPAVRNLNESTEMKAVIDDAAKGLVKADDPRMQLYRKSYQHVLKQCYEADGVPEDLQCMASEMDFTFLKNATGQELDKLSSDFAQAPEEGGYGTEFYWFARKAALERGVEKEKLGEDAGFSASLVSYTALSQMTDQAQRKELAGTMRDFAATREWAKNGGIKAAIAQNPDFLKDLDTAMINARESASYMNPLFRSSEWSGKEVTEANLMLAMQDVHGSGAMASAFSDLGRLTAAKYLADYQNAAKNLDPAKAKEVQKDAANRGLRAMSAAYLLMPAGGAGEVSDTPMYTLFPAFSVKGRSALDSAASGSMANAENVNRLPAAIVDAVFNPMGADVGRHGETNWFWQAPGKGAATYPEGAVGQVADLVTTFRRFAKRNNFLNTAMGAQNPMDSTLPFPIVSSLFRGGYYSNTDPTLPNLTAEFQGAFPRPKEYTYNFNAVYLDPKGKTPILKKSGVEGMLEALPSKAKGDLTLMENIKALDKLGASPESLNRRVVFYDGNFRYRMSPNGKETRLLVRSKGSDTFVQAYDADHKKMAVGNQFVYHSAEHVQGSTGTMRMALGQEEKTRLMSEANAYAEDYVKTKEFKAQVQAAVDKDTAEYQRIEAEQAAKPRRDIPWTPIRDAELRFTQQAEKAKMQARDAYYQKLTIQQMQSDIAQPDPFDEKRRAESLRSKTTPAKSK